VELVDRLQISSVSSAQSDSLMRTSWPILILEWLYRLYSLSTRLSLPYNQEERAWCMTFPRNAVNSLYLNLMIPIKNAYNADMCGTTIPCSCRLGTGCARAEYMYTSNLEGRKMMWYVSCPVGHQTHYIPQWRSVLEWSLRNVSGFAVCTYFLPRGVTGLTSHWAVIQLTYWGERERAPPSEVAEQNVCLYHTLCHKLLAALILHYIA